MSGKAQNLHIIWLEPGILAMSSMDNHVRLWDLDNEDNCILTLASDRGYTSSDLVTCIAYCSVRCKFEHPRAEAGVNIWILCSNHCRWYKFG